MTTNRANDIERDLDASLLTVAGMDEQEYVLHHRGSGLYEFSGIHPATI